MNHIIRNRLLTDDEARHYKSATRAEESGDYVEVNARDFKKLVRLFFPETRLTAKVTEHRRRHTTK